MSGFEIAGAVLGSIPLLISGLEHYRDGIQTIDNMIKYVIVTNDILTTVSTSLAIYRQSFVALVHRLMLPENVIDEICYNRDSTLWKDQSLDDKLQEEFTSPAEYGTYCLAVRRLEKRIAKLKSKLELNQDFQPPWMVNNQPDPGSLASFFSLSHRVRRAVRIGFSNGKYIELANGIEADVHRIKTLTEGTRTLDPMKAERRVKAMAKKWLHARICGESLFTALSSRWPRSCQCHTTHIVSIPLGRGEPTNLWDVEDQQKHISLLLSFDITAQPPCPVPWDWRVVEVDPLMATTPASEILHGGGCMSQTCTPSVSTPMPAVILVKETSTPQGQSKVTVPMITNLCQALSQVQYHVKHIGFLHDDVWQHRLRLVKPWRGLESNTCFISVAEALKTRGSLGTKIKFKTAASLALAVLKFHATPWLHDRWDLRDIFFLDSPNDHVDTKQTFLSRHFTNSCLNLSAHQQASLEPVIDNEVIFCLGVALLELFYGRPILDFKKPEDEQGNTTLLLTKYLIAKRLVEQLKGREPEALVDAVDRCIRCRFDTVSRSLHEGDLLALFIQSVVNELWKLYLTMA